MEHIDEEGVNLKERKLHEIRSKYMSLESENFNFGIEKNIEEDKEVDVS